MIPPSGQIYRLEIGLADFALSLKVANRSVGKCYEDARLSLENGDHSIEVGDNIAGAPAGWDNAK